MNAFFILLFCFLAATSLILVIFFLAQAAQNSPQARIQKRMTTISLNPEASQAEVQRLLKGSLYSEIPWFQQLLVQLPFARHLDLLLERANLNISVGMLLLFSFAAGGPAFFLTSTLFHQPVLLALAAGALAAASPYLYARYMARKRLRRFLGQMPDGLDMMSQGLQAGLGLSQAQVYVAKEAADPIGTEFAIFMEELNLGLPIREALAGFQRRIPLPEMRLFCTALLVQRDVGGSLAELLNKLADVIRERFRIEREIRTLTAQNRMAAWVVCSLPPTLTAFMFFMNPVLMNEVVHHPVGRVMFTAALILEILGILAFRRLLRLHI